jgi:hypothetical protein
MRFDPILQFRMGRLIDEPGIETFHTWAFGANISARAMKPVRKSMAIQGCPWLFPGSWA